MALPHSIQNAENMGISSLKHFLSLDLLLMKPKIWKFMPTLEIEILCFSFHREFLPIIISFIGYDFSY